MENVKKILSEIDDLTADVRDDVKKAINIAGDIDTDFFWKLNPYSKAENLTTIEVVFENYSQKMSIVLDYLCRLDDTAKKLKEILAKCEKIQEDGEPS